MNSVLQSRKNSFARHTTFFKNLKPVLRSQIKFVSSTQIVTCSVSRASNWKRLWQHNFLEKFRNYPKSCFGSSDRLTITYKCARKPDRSVVDMIQSHCKTEQIGFGTRAEFRHFVPFSYFFCITLTIRIDDIRSSMDTCCLEQSRFLVLSYSKK